MKGEDVSEWIGIVLGAVTVLLFLVLHIWAVVLGFMAGGIGTALVALLLPFLTEIFLTRMFWAAAGPGHPYCILAFVCAGLMIFWWLKEKME